MPSTRIATLCALIAATTVLPLVACSGYRSSGGQTRAERRDTLIHEANETVERFRSNDSSLVKFFDTCVGYAVFPKVTKGAAGVGAAHGRGVLFENGRAVGFTELTQGTIGLQLGGQTYSELIFFQHNTVLRNFKNGNLEFQAQASAVAAESGAGAAADFENGVAVFTMTRAGLMFEAAIGGQKFSYTPR